MGETAEMIHEDALPRTGERARFEAGLASSISAHMTPQRRPLSRRAGSQPR